SFIVFFFSSRRRHTRSKRDWSSDVCSSDLTLVVTFTDERLFAERATFSSVLAVTTNVFVSAANASSIFIKSFVFGTSNEISSNKMRLFSCTLEDNADLSAKRLTFLGIL